MIRRLRQFAKLSSSDRLLLIEAAVTLAAVRLALWLGPTRLLLPTTTKPGTGSSVPGGTPLSQAGFLPVETAACPRVSLRGPTLSQAFSPPHRGQSAAPSPHGRPLPATRIAWAVQAVAAAIPNSTCLVRAVAAHRMLRKHGCPSTVKIGVRLRPFQAHAWLECDGRVLVGGDTQSYAELPLPRDMQ